jgi:hypothetical protein
MKRKQPGTTPHSWLRYLLIPAVAATKVELELAMDDELEVNAAAFRRLVDGFR